MDLIILIITLIPITMMLVSFINLKLALFLYIVYKVCVPYLNIHILGLTLGYNLVHMVFLLSFLFHATKKKQKILFKEVSPYLFFYIVTFFMMFIQNRISFGEQFAMWRSDMLITLIVPFIIFNIGRYDKDLVKYLRWALLTAMLIAGVYAVFLQTMPAGINPYLMVIAPLNGAEYSIEYADDATRALPRIFSTFSHPLTWCFFLSFFLITYWNFYKVSNKYMYLFILLLALYDLIFCGVRTGIAALTVPIAYLMLKRGELKYLKYLVLLGCVVILIIANNDLLYDYFYSIVDSSSTDTKGSSIDMRLIQWEGCLDECSGRELIGNGFRWTDYYISKFGNHPKAVTFESLIFVIYTNWGILGFLIWGATFLKIYRINHKKFNNKNLCYSLDALLLLYIVFSTLTGEYHYMGWFALFYSILYVYLKQIDVKKFVLYRQ